MLFIVILRVFVVPDIQVEPRQERLEESDIGTGSIVDHLVERRSPGLPPISAKRGHGFFVIQRPSNASDPSADRKPLLPRIVVCRGVVHYIEVTHEASE